MKKVAPTKDRERQCAGAVCRHEASPRPRDENGPAVMTALELGLEVVYARKQKPITMPDQVLLTIAPSHTKGRNVELIVSPEYLGAGERVLVIDDFLASGQTILGLARLVKAAGGAVVGVGALIEKTFEGGRDVLASLNVPIETLVRITNMDDGRIELGS